MPEPDDELLTVKDLADRLRACTATVYKMVDRLNVPQIRILNSLRFRQSDVKKFLEEALGQAATRQVSSFP